MICSHVAGSLSSRGQMEQPARSPLSAQVPQIAPLPAVNDCLTQRHGCVRTLNGMGVGAERPAYQRTTHWLRATTSECYFFEHKVGHLCFNISTDPSTRPPEAPQHIRHSIRIPVTDQASGLLLFPLLAPYLVHGVASACEHVNMTSDKLRAGASRLSRGYMSLSACFGSA